MEKLSSARLGSRWPETPIKELQWFVVFISNPIIMKTNLIDNWIFKNIDWLYLGATLVDSLDTMYIMGLTKGKYYTLLLIIALHVHIISNKWKCRIWRSAFMGEGKALFQRRSLYKSLRDDDPCTWRTFEHIPLVRRQPLLRKSGSYKLPFLKKY